VILSYLFPKSYITKTVKLGDEEIEQPGG
jgi:hypothetical protein